MPIIASAADTFCCKGKEFNMTFTIKSSQAVGNNNYNNAISYCSNVEYKEDVIILHGC